MAANAGETKVKLWEGICYPENMRDDWQDEIDDILQVPFAYAVHDIDHDQKSKQRKTHAHIIVVWGGNTTRKAIINVLNRLSADGKKCCSSAEPINNIRHAYDY
ncbi:MAG: Rep family protein, partial [Clostridium botulinum]|nr:Rep family protein [Clostridium botulinum]